MRTVRLFVARLYGSRMTRWRVAPLTLLFSLLSLPGMAQQDYVSRYDAYAGFSYFESPAINLAERGFHLQFGLNMKPWWALGADYSNATGTLSLIPSYLPNDLQKQIDEILVFLPGYMPSVTTDVHTQTFAIGPTLVYRHFRHIGLLVHPSIGAVREVATPYPTDAFTEILVSQFVTGKNKVDWRGFYGIGGGVDIGITQHVGTRMHTDLVWDHLFDDILRDGRWTVRCSIGPTFKFGRNIAK